MKNNENLPVQVSQMMFTLLNTKEPVYIRANIRPRLVAIRDAIDDALEKFDKEYDDEFRKRK